MLHTSYNTISHILQLNSPDKAALHTEVKEVTFFIREGGGGNGLLKWLLRYRLECKLEALRLILKVVLA